VPGDFYFITDASISYRHLLALDMAGIMDKWMTGDYLAREPRYANMAYTLTLLLPLLVPAIRRRVFDTLPRRQFLFVIYLSVFFTMWATLGYSEPGWLPTFHRTIAAISRLAYGAQSTVGDLVLTITSTIVQVLRFPHRFELVLFMLECVLMPIPLVLGIEWTQGYIRRSLCRWPWSGKAVAFAVTPVFSLLFLGPLFSSWQYRDTFLSGDMMGFLRPYPVTPLKEVKEELLKHPPGKVVVLPPTETAKVIVDIAGNEHKFIDKFHIYYLDLPSFYYGLTGDSDNKFEFFLLLRALYYQQDWWVNIARDVGIRYLVINRELIANTVGGAEYLREIEKVILPELDQMPEYLAKIYENESYVVYEFTDLPQAARIPLFVDLDWSGFIKLLSANPDLTRYYDLRHLVVSDDLTGEIAGSALDDEFTGSATASGEADLGSSMNTGEELALVTNDPHAAALDLYIKAHKDRFFGPAANIYAFSPDIIPSSYYLSPMFRLFQFFSDSKWNRLNLITPGLYGTIQGSFIGVPRATTFRIAAKAPEPGRYRVLLRGAATANTIRVKAKSLGLDETVELRARSGYLDFYDKRAVFTANRQPLDVNAYTPAELERLIPGDIVAVNNRYHYFDLGTVEATKGGKHTFYFTKQDTNPLLVEGIVLIPEEEYRTLELPPNVRILDTSDLCCAPLGGQP
jgi:hypothetical protein